MATPLKIKDASGNIQQFTTAEENYLAYQIGLQLADAGTDSAGAIRTGSGTSIGSFTNTFFNQSVGTHPSTAITTGTTTYTLYQNQDSSNVAETDSDWHRPLMWVDSASQTGFKEMPDADLNSAVDRYLQTIFTNDYPGTFKLASSSPGPDYSVHLSSVFTDTRTDGTSTAYNIYKRTAYTAPSTVRPLYVRDNGGFDGIQAMTDRQIKFSFGQRAKRRIAKSKIGTYQFRSSTQGAPTDPGTWVPVGTATDTKQTTSDQTYTRDSTLNFVGNYTQNYTGAYSTNYTRLYSIDYTYPYDTTYTLPYAISYTKGTVESFSSIFTTLAGYTNLYSNVFTNQFDTLYASTQYDINTVFTPAGEAGFIPRYEGPAYGGPRRYQDVTYTGLLVPSYIQNAYTGNIYQAITDGGYIGGATLYATYSRTTYSGNRADYATYTQTRYEGLDQQFIQGFPYNQVYDVSTYVANVDPGARYSGSPLNVSYQSDFITTNYNGPVNTYVTYTGANYQNLANYLGGTSYVRYADISSYLGQITNYDNNIYATYEISYQQTTYTSLKEFVRYTGGDPLSYVPDNFVSYIPGVDEIPISYVSEGNPYQLTSYLNEQPSYSSPAYSSGPEDAYQGPTYAGRSPTYYQGVATYYDQNVYAGYTTSYELIYYENLTINQPLYLSTYVGLGFYDLNSYTPTYTLGTSETYTGPSPYYYVNFNISNYYTGNYIGFGGNRVGYTGLNTTYAVTVPSFADYGSYVIYEGPGGSYTRQIDYGIGQRFYQTAAYQTLENYNTYEALSVYNTYSAVATYVAPDRAEYYIPGPDYSSELTYTSASFAIVAYIGPQDYNNIEIQPGYTVPRYLASGTFANIEYLSGSSSYIGTYTADQIYSREITVSYDNASNYTIGYVGNYGNESYTGPATTLFYGGPGTENYANVNYIGTIASYGVSGYVSETGFESYVSAPVYQNSYVTSYDIELSSLSYQSGMYGNAFTNTFYQNPELDTIYTGAYSATGFGSLVYTNQDIQYYVPSYVPGTDEIPYTEPYTGTYTKLYTPQYTLNYTSEYTGLLSYGTPAFYDVNYVLATTYTSLQYEKEPVVFTSTFNNLAPPNSYGRIATADDGIPGLIYANPTSYTRSITTADYQNSLIGMGIFVSGVLAYLAGDESNPTGQFATATFYTGNYQGPSIFAGFQNYLGVFPYTSVYSKNNYIGNYVSNRDYTNNLYSNPVVYQLNYTGNYTGDDTGPAYTVITAYFAVSSNYTQLNYSDPTDTIQYSGPGTQYASTAGPYTASNDYISDVNYVAAAYTEPYTVSNYSGPNTIYTAPQPIFSTTYIADTPAYYAGNYTGNRFYEGQPTYLGNYVLHGPLYTNWRDGTGFNTELGNVDIQFFLREISYLGPIKYYTSPVNIFNTGIYSAGTTDGTLGYVQDSYASSNIVAYYLRGENEGMSDQYYIGGSKTSYDINYTISATYQGIGTASYVGPSYVRLIGYYSGSARNSSFAGSYLGSNPTNYLGVAGYIHGYVDPMVSYTNYGFPIVNEYYIKDGYIPGNINEPIYNSFGLNYNGYLAGGYISLDNPYDDSQIVSVYGADAIAAYNVNYTGPGIPFTSTVAFTNSVIESRQYTNEGIFVADYITGPDPASYPVYYTSDTTIITNYDKVNNYTSVEERYERLFASEYGTVGDGLILQGYTGSDYIAPSRTIITNYLGNTFLLQTGFYLGGNPALNYAGPPITSYYAGPSKSFQQTEDATRTYIGAPTTFLGELQLTAPNQNQTGEVTTSTRYYQGPNQPRYYAAEELDLRYQTTYSLYAKEYTRLGRGYVNGGVEYTLYFYPTYLSIQNFFTSPAPSPINQLTYTGTPTNYQSTNFVNYTAGVDTLGDQANAYGAYGANSYDSITNFISNVYLNLDDYSGGIKIPGTNYTGDLTLTARYETFLNSETQYIQGQAYTPTSFYVGPTYLGLGRYFSVADPNPQQYTKSYEDDYNLTTYTGPNTFGVSSYYTVGGYDKVYSAGESVYISGVYTGLNASYYAGLLGPNAYLTTAPVQYNTGPAFVVYSGIEPNVYEGGDNIAFVAQSGYQGRDDFVSRIYISGGSFLGLRYTAPLGFRDQYYIPGDDGTVYLGDGTGVYGGAVAGTYSTLLRQGYSVQYIVSDYTSVDVGLRQRYTGSYLSNTYYTGQDLEPVTTAFAPVGQVFLRYDGAPVSVSYVSGGFVSTNNNQIIPNSFEGDLTYYQSGNISYSDLAYTGNATSSYISLPQAIYYGNQFDTSLYYVQSKYAPNSLAIGNYIAEFVQGDSLYGGALQYQTAIGTGAYSSQDYSLLTPHSYLNIVGYGSPTLYGLTEFYGGGSFAYANEVTFEINDFVGPTQYYVPTGGLYTRTSGPAYDGVELYGQIYQTFTGGFPANYEGTYIAGDTTGFYNTSYTSFSNTETLLSYSSFVTFEGDTYVRTGPSYLGLPTADGQNYLGISSNEADNLYTNPRNYSSSTALYDDGIVTNQDYSGPIPSFSGYLGSKFYTSLTVNYTNTAVGIYYTGVGNYLSVGRFLGPAGSYTGPAIGTSPVTFKNYVGEMTIAYLGAGPSYYTGVAPRTSYTNTPGDGSYISNYNSTIYYDSQKPSYSTSYSRDLVYLDLSRPASNNLAYVETEIGEYVGANLQMQTFYYLGAGVYTGNFYLGVNPTNVTQPVAYLGPANYYTGPIQYERPAQEFQGSYTSNQYDTSYTWQASYAGTSGTYDNNAVAFANQEGLVYMRGPGTTYSGQPTTYLGPVYVVEPVFSAIYTGAFQYLGGPYTGQSYAAAQSSYEGMLAPVYYNGYESLGLYPINQQFAIYSQSSYGLVSYSNLDINYTQSYEGGAFYTEPATYGSDIYSETYTGPLYDIIYTENYLLNYTGLNPTAYDPTPVYTTATDNYVPDGATYIGGPYVQDYIEGYTNAYSSNYGAETYTGNLTRYSSIFESSFTPVSNIYTGGYENTSGLGADYLTMNSYTVGGVFSATYTTGAAQTISYQGFTGSTGVGQTSIYVSGDRPTYSSYTELGFYRYTVLRYNQTYSDQYTLNQFNSSAVYSGPVYTLGRDKYASYNDFVGSYSGGIPTNYTLTYATYDEINYLSILGGYESGAYTGVSNAVGNYVAQYVGQTPQYAGEYLFFIGSAYLHVPYGSYQDPINAYGGYSNRYYGDPVFYSSGYVVGGQGVYDGDENYAGYSSGRQDYLSSNTLDNVYYSTQYGLYTNRYTSAGRYFAAPGDYRDYAQGYQSVIPVQLSYLGFARYISGAVNYTSLSYQIRYTNVPNFYIAGQYTGPNTVYVGGTSYNRAQFYTNNSSSNPYTGTSSYVGTDGYYTTNYDPRSSYETYGAQKFEGRRGDTDYATYMGPVGNLYLSEGTRYLRDVYSGQTYIGPTGTYLGVTRRYGTGVYDGTFYYSGSIEERYFVNPYIGLTTYTGPGNYYLGGTQLYTNEDLLGNQFYEGGDQYLIYLNNVYTSPSGSPPVYQEYIAGPSTGVAQASLYINAFNTAISYLGPVAKNVTFTSGLIYQNEVFSTTYQADTKVVPLVYEAIYSNQRVYGAEDLNLFFNTFYYVSLYAGYQKEYLGPQTSYEIQTPNDGIADYGRTYGESPYAAVQPLVFVNDYVARYNNFMPGVYTGPRSIFYGVSYTLDNASYDRNIINSYTNDTNQYSTTKVFGTYSDYYTDGGTYVVGYTDQSYTSTISYTSIQEGNIFAGTNYIGQTYNVYVGSGTTGFQSKSNSGYLVSYSGDTSYVRNHYTAGKLYGTNVGYAGPESFVTVGGNVYTGLVNTITYQPLYTNEGIYEGPALYAQGGVYTNSFYELGGKDLAAFYITGQYIGDKDYNGYGAYNNPGFYNTYGTGALAYEGLQYYTGTTYLGPIPTRTMYGDRINYVSDTYYYVKTYTGSTSFYLADYEGIGPGGYTSLDPENIYSGLNNYLVIGASYYLSNNPGSYTGELRYVSPAQYYTSVIRGNYDSTQFQTDYGSSNTFYYTSAYQTNYLDQYTAFFAGLYSTLYNIDYIGDYNISYTADYQNEYAGDYIAEYSTTFDAIYQQDYLGNFAGDFAGETIDATSTTNETYTLYVRIA